MRAGWPDFIAENIENCWAAEQNIQNFKKNEKKVKSVQERLSATLRSSFGIKYKAGSSWKSEKVRLF